MSGSEVRAILDRRKCQARRVVKPQPDMSKVSQPCHAESRGATWVWMARDDAPGYSYATEDFRCPFGQPGDLLWCQETWKHHSIYAHLKPRDLPRSNVFFRADDRYAPSNTPWRPSIHMPRWASRLTLELTDVRAQRVQEISADDCEAEGVQWRGGDMGIYRQRRADNAVAARRYQTGMRKLFRELWDSLNARRGHGWNENDWVWCLSFRAHRQNVDALIEERRPHRELPSVDDILDEDFTGGLRTEEYLERLRNGQL